MKAVVSEKGQVTIPKRLRERLGIKPGQTLDFEEDRGVLVGRKVAPDAHRQALERWRGFLKNDYPGLNSDDLLDELRGPRPE